jgi:hypothetical protein
MAIGTRSFPVSSEVIDGPEESNEASSWAWERMYEGLLLDRPFGADDSGLKEANSLSKVAISRESWSSAGQVITEGVLGLESVSFCIVVGIGRERVKEIPMAIPGSYEFLWP